MGIAHLISHSCGRVSRSIAVRTRRSALVPFRCARGVARTRAQWQEADSDAYRRLKSRTLDYVASLRIEREGPGAYAYKPGGPALLYSSCYAALTLHLCGKLGSVCEEERSRWAARIRAHQDGDGWFRDPRIACPEAEMHDWWGWRHLTLHALMALSALGARADRPFRALEPLAQPSGLREWIGTRNWAGDVAAVSNEVQNYGTLMQYARDISGQAEWALRLEQLHAEIEARQDPATGLWGSRHRTVVERSQGVQAAYHFWMLSCYDRRPVRHAAAALKSCVAIQTRYGGFGSEANTSACEDIDSIDPIARLLVAGTAVPTSSMHTILQKALTWVIYNQNPDGGWVFRRHERFTYGHTLMASEPNESNLFATWFRLLSLAMLSRALPGHPLGTLEWRFLDAPGLQHFRFAPTSSGQPADPALPRP